MSRRRVIWMEKPQRALDLPSAIRQRAYSQGSSLKPFNWHATADDIGATFAPLDVASEADWDAVDERFPALDVLVHYAGSPGWRS